MVLSGGVPALRCIPYGCFLAEMSVCAVRATRCYRNRAGPRQQLAGSRVLGPPEAPHLSRNSGVIGTGWLLSKMEISSLARGRDLGLHPRSLSLSLATFQGSLCSQRASDKLLGRGAVALAWLKTELVFF